MQVQHYKDSKTYHVKSKKDDKFYTEGDTFFIKILNLSNKRIGIHTEERSKQYTWRVFQSLEDFRSSFEILSTTDLSLEDFKKRYFSNNFYWVNEDNFMTLQEIGLEVGCVCHTMKREFIEWHQGFNNLAFRTYEKNNNKTVFQKEPFLSEKEEATSFNEMLSYAKEFFSLSKS